MLEIVPGQMIDASGFPTFVWGAGWSVDTLNQNYRIVNPVFGAAVAIDLSQGSWFRITATTAAAFTVSNPINAGTVSGQEIQITIRNTSGGALGALTFGTLYKIGGAWTQPATGFSRTIQFSFDGTNWIETGRSAADVSN